MTVYPKYDPSKHTRSERDYGEWRCPRCNAPLGGFSIREMKCTNSHYWLVGVFT